MKRKSAIGTLLTTLVVLACLARHGTDGLSLSMTQVPELITGRCYNLTADARRTPALLGQQDVHAQTIDNFISLVEKIEFKMETEMRQPVDAISLARMLLKR